MGCWSRRVAQAANGQLRSARTVAVEHILQCTLPILRTPQPLAHALKLRRLQASVQHLPGTGVF